MEESERCSQKHHICSAGYQLCIQEVFGLEESTSPQWNFYSEYSAELGPWLDHAISPFSVMRYFLVAWLPLLWVWAGLNWRGLWRAFKGNQRELSVKKNTGNLLSESDRFYLFTVFLLVSNPPQQLHQQWWCRAGMSETTANIHNKSVCLLEA